MYEERSHATLNKILDDIDLSVEQKDLRYFFSRLGANFYAIHSLFYTLYGSRDDFELQLKSLVETMAKRYSQRKEAFKVKDKLRESNKEWFLNESIVGMALYANGFADNLSDLHSKLDYFAELGVNLIHILPILQCPEGKSDGGYAVSDFHKVDPRIGTNNCLKKIIDTLHNQDSLIALDIVVNHVSNEHEWAQKASSGDKEYQDFFYMFDSKHIPEMFEQTMPEIFPETDEGNFSWDKESQKWVMTVFHHYQWDLNYSNPRVFIEMLDIILFWANQGIDILRLDAVAFLWKKLGSTGQNEDEAHKILQLFKDCCQVVAPSLIFIAEAIVAPSEIVKYFGEDAIIAKECDIAYNATFMALLWDAVATKNIKLLSKGLANFPEKLDGATWLNYLRCHDDIGFGFDDKDIAAIGYDPKLHRDFLANYFFGNHECSTAMGKPFGVNPKTGDSRVSGSLASLVGLENAVKHGNEALITSSCKHIILLHSMIMSFGGIPLLYYGDEVGTLNDYSYLENDHKRTDSRWIHRPKINWDTVANKDTKGTYQNTLFEQLQKLIKIRKQQTAFADLNNREIINLGNDSIFCFVRHDYLEPTNSVIIMANFSDKPQKISIHHFFEKINTYPFKLYDIWLNNQVHIVSDHIVFNGFEFKWLKDMHEISAA